MLGRRKEVGVPSDASGDELSTDERKFAPTQVRTAPEEPVHKRLGDILLEERVISQQQLDAAIAIQKQKGGFLGQILVTEGFVTQNQVASCLVKQCKIPHLSLLDYDISQEVLALVPEEICKRYRLLPIDKLGRILTVAMVDPLDLEALEQVRLTCPELRIKPILCNWEHFQTVAQRIFAHDKNKDGQQVITARSLGLSDRPAAKAAPEAAEPAASPAPPVPAREIPAAHEVLPPPHAAPSYSPEEMATTMRDTMRELMESAQHPPAPAAAPAWSAEAMTAAMRETLKDLMAAQPPAPVNDAPQAGMAAAIRETLREALEANQRQQQMQEARLAQIAESILQSVQQNQQLLEQNVVKEGVRRDLQEGAKGRAETVIPFKHYQDAQLSARDDALVMRESDTRVMEALYSEHPLEALTFENFFPGGANDFTFKLSQAVADHPGLEYNPFFLYGHVGIGKTHLINAMGNAILAKRPDHRVGYISASHFSRRVMEAEEDRTLDSFRENFFHWEVLILDDIQFLAGRVDAQEEFFHIFNVLHQQARQIIIASDKPPDRLGLLEQRLISRFASGIVAELKAPEWETRTQILRHRVAQLERPPSIPDEVYSLVAMRVPNDVRKMTGAMRKIVAYARLVGQDITLEMAAEIVKHLHLDPEA